MRQLKRRGGNAIEFALIMPVLCTVFLTLMNFGWLEAVRTGATAAARVGARTGALTAPTATPNPDTAASTAALNKWTSMGIMSASAVTITATRTGTPQLMQVRVRVNTTGLISILPTSWRPANITVTATQPMETQP